MKFITREEIKKELEKKGYAEVLGYYYYENGINKKSI